MTDVTQATEQLLEAMRQTDEYRRYAAAKQTVAADAEQSALLRRFLRAQTAVQMAALSGAEAREADVTAFEALSALVYASDELTEFLLAQMSVQQLVAKTMERVTREVGLEIELPEC